MSKPSLPHRKYPVAVTVAGSVGGADFSDAPSTPTRRTCSYLS